jgi:hypothetical protein
MTEEINHIAPDDTYLFDTQTPLANIPNGKYLDGTIPQWIDEELETPNRILVECLATNTESHEEIVSTIDHEETDTIVLGLHLADLADEYPPYYTPKSQEPNQGEIDYENNSYATIAIVNRKVIKELKQKAVTTQIQRTTAGQYLYKPPRSAMGQ